MIVEVHIDKRLEFGATRFWIIERTQLEGKIYVLQFTKKGVKRIGPLDSFQEAPPPTFTLGADCASQFIKSVAELAVKHGIKTESDLKMEGRMAAVEAHLADMRKLVFQSGEVKKP